MSDYHILFASRKLIHTPAAQPAPNSVTLAHHPCNPLKSNRLPPSGCYPEAIGRQVDARLKSSIVNTLMGLYEVNPKSAILLGRAVLHVWPGFSHA
jgi:hypothetical protein